MTRWQYAPLDLCNGFRSEQRTSSATRSLRQTPEADRNLRKHGAGRHRGHRTAVAGRAPGQAARRADALAAFGPAQDAETTARSMNELDELLSDLAWDDGEDVLGDLADKRQRQDARVGDYRSQLDTWKNQVLALTKAVEDARRVRARGRGRKGCLDPLAGQGAAGATGSRREELQADHGISGPTQVGRTERPGAYREGAR